LDRRGVRHIAGRQEDLSALAGEFDFETSGGLLGGVVIHHHVITGVGQRDRDGASGPDCATCDKSDRRHGQEPTVRRIVSKLNQSSDKGDQ
jgi:hypothetical protein